MIDLFLPPSSVLSNVSVIPKTSQESLPPFPGEEEVTARACLKLDGDGVLSAERLEAEATPVSVRQSRFGMPNGRSADWTGTSLATSQCYLGQWQI
jgi:hypothetical protein